MGDNHFEISRPILVAGILWIGIILLLLVIEVSIVKGLTVDLAKDRGRSFFQLIEITRLWNARHGGVYVPVTSDNPPNPYLDMDDRDIVTVEGRKYTKINPAYMTRQLADITQDTHHVRFRITSLDPIRPENAATPWETKALNSFVDGQAEVIEQLHHNGRDVYRYMAPLRVQQACLQCHRSQGYKENDIRGGISIDIPASSFAQTESFQIRALVGQNVFLLLVGLLFLYVLNMATSHKQTAELAFVDALTKINNRRGFDNSLQLEWNRALRAGTPLSLLMIDVDQFKPYNDYYGHQKGDETLQLIAHALDHQIKRPGDFVARYGGEEFAAVLTTDERGALSIAERMCGAIESLAIPHEHSIVESHVTISIGLAGMVPSRDTSPTELIAIADEALYRAKQEGRNRVVATSNGKAAQA